MVDESEKLNATHKNLKKEFKELHIKYEKELDEEVILRNKICNLEMKESSNVEHPVECLSCKSHMLDIDILENLLEVATRNNNVEMSIPVKKVYKNKRVFKSENQIKRTRRVWVEKGTVCYRNLNVSTCFYCMKKGHTSNKCGIKHFDVLNEKYAWILVIK